MTFNSPCRQQSSKYWRHRWPRALDSVSHQTKFVWKSNNYLYKVCTQCHTIAGKQYKITIDKTLAQADPGIESLKHLRVPLKHKHKTIKTRIQNVQVTSKTLSDVRPIHYSVGGLINYCQTADESENNHVHADRKKKHLGLFLFHSFSFINSQPGTYLSHNIFVLVVQWFDVGLVIERLLVRLPAGALSSHLGRLSLPSLRGR